MNAVKTAFLMTLLTVILVIAGGAIGGRGGAVFALVLAAVMNFAGYWWSDKVALRMHHARRLEPGEAPELQEMVRELAQRASLPMPRVYLIPSATPNAFATGRDPAHAAVAVTEGALRLLDRNELRGVMAHELAHVKHRDILVASLAATMAGAITMLAHMAQFAAIFGGHRGDDRQGTNPLALIAMAILAPIAAMLVQMAISRSREYLADEGGARISGDPIPLAQALRKLEAYAQRLPMQGNPASAHLFIVNPFRGGMAGLFSTHPSTESRVERLLGMAGR